MMYSNNIENFQECTTILNACTKKVWKPIEGTMYMVPAFARFKTKEYDIYTVDLEVGIQLYKEKTHTILIAFIIQTKVKNNIYFLSGLFFKHMRL